jgi:hypothetical protein
VCGSCRCNNCVPNLHTQLSVHSFSCCVHAMSNELVWRCAGADKGGGSALKSCWHLIRDKIKP